MMRVLRRLELVHDYDGQWFNSRIIQVYLVDSSPDYMGDFFLYRRYMKPQWSDLLKKVSRAHHVHRTPLSGDDDYEVRNFHYVRSLDPLAGHQTSYLSSLKTSARMIRILVPSAGPHPYHKPLDICSPLTSL
jgi:hypothetical protein